MVIAYLPPDFAQCIVLRVDCPTLETCSCALLD